MNLALGVSFDEVKHEYWYKGKQLSGITALVAKKLGLKYSNAFVGEHAEEGIHIHKAVQKWINTGELESVHPGVLWIIETLKEARHLRFEKHNFFSETLVSDLKQYASAVDIIGINPAWVKGSLDIYDIKKGKFNREYVTWQLSVYKYFIDKYTDFDVNDCYCLAVKDREVYKIFPKKREDVEKLLYD